MKANEEKKILEAFPENAKEFIKLVIKNMRYRKSVRQEVMEELTTHFEDELKSCKDEKEKEDKAKQLIEQFGDPKVLGVLLRRAKKRCRPLWRTAIVRAFQTAAVLIVCLFIYVTWFLSGKPLITTDYIAELNLIVRPAANESQNAAPLYEKAVQLLKANTDYNDVKRLIDKNYEDTNSIEKTRIEKFISENPVVFDLVYEGTHRPYFWMTYRAEDPNEGLIGVLLPQLGNFRSLARLLIFKSQRAAEQNRFNDSFDDLISCYRLGRQIRQGNNILVEQLVGIAIEALSTNQICKILATSKIEPIYLSALQKNLEQIISDEDFVVNFKSEELFMYDETQRCFTDSCFGSHLYLPRVAKLSSMLGPVEPLSVLLGSLKTPKTTFHILFTHPDKQQTQQAAERYYDYLESIARKSPAQIHSEGIDVGKESMKIVEGNLLLEMLSPALGRVIELSSRNKISVKSTLTIIALVRYNQDKGQYPDSLKELVDSGYLKELPADPWSDKPLVYKKTDKGFILYSIGLNSKDDGGVVARDKEGNVQMWNNNEGDAVFWPVEK